MREELRGKRYERIQVAAQHVIQLNPPSSLIPLSFKILLLQRASRSLRESNEDGDAHRALIAGR
jgi:hypothetical protein